ncbi:MAG: ABC transporter ATP-binding protein [Limnobacter sp.]|nr:ABC transporter ATP-binding protein [Limnobacter sp.]
MTHEPLLNVKGMTVAYGGLQAVKGVSFKIARGELVCLIGSNGAGKTTTLNALAGLLPFEAHQAQYNHLNLIALGAHERLPAGLVLVPEGRGVFKRMTIEENLRIGGMHRLKAGALKEKMQEVYDLFPRLKERRHQSAGTLSGGEQQMLAMGRAMMSEPKLLLLDEPSMGLAPIMVEKIFQVIETISKQGTSILLVEQNAQIALEIANRGYVMDSGLIEFQDQADKLLRDPRVREAYLGESGAESASDVNASE